MPDNKKKRDPRGATLISKVGVKEQNKPWIESLKSYSQQRNDPFADSYDVAGDGNTLIQPTFDPALLLKLPNQNNVLRQCIDAMQTNIECFGHSFEYVGPDAQAESVESLTELDRLKTFMESPNEEYGLTEMRKRFRADLESVGYAAIEIVRDVKREIVAMYHVDAYTLRRTVVEDVGVPVKIILPSTDSGTERILNSTKKFRRYAQLIGNTKVWFKEFGDPRTVDPTTGVENTGLAIEDAATEIVFKAQYESGHTYGLPRWINQLPSILGSRESEMTNFHFFEDNAIPPLAILVSGGMLTEASIENLQQKFNGASGQENMHKVLILEAESVEDEGLDNMSGKAAPRIELKPMAGIRQDDELFGKYDRSCQDKIRGAFRLPPIFVGRADDYTRATAQASLDTAESQVFAPERTQIDDLFNYKFLTDKDNRPPKFWRFKSNPARITDSTSIVEVIKAMDTVGAMTPNVAISVINELFNMERDSIEEPWGDMPFAIVMELVEKGELPNIALGEMFGPMLPEGVLDNAGPAVDEASPDSEPAIEPDDELDTEEDE
jgi:PBSX family phage portal protein